MPLQRNINGKLLRLEAGTLATQCCCTGDGGSCPCPTDDLKYEITSDISFIGYEYHCGEATDWGAQNVGDFIPQDYCVNDGCCGDAGLGLGISMCYNNPTTGILYYDSNTDSWAGGGMMLTIDRNTCTSYLSAYFSLTYCFDTPLMEIPLSKDGCPDGSWIGTLSWSYNPAVNWFQIEDSSDPEHIWIKECYATCHYKFEASNITISPL